MLSNVERASALPCLSGVQPGGAGAIDCKTKVLAAWGKKQIPRSARDDNSDIRYGLNEVLNLLVQPERWPEDQLYHL